MIKEERFELIMTILHKKHFASITELQSSTNIPISTLRRDILDLAAAGKLTKLRGGASLTPDAETRGTSEEPTFSARGKNNIEEKERIAQAALNYIRNGDTIIMDCGTTTYELAKKVKNFKNLMVASSDLLAAATMADDPDINLIVVGGKARSSYYSMVGIFAENVLKQIHADTAFISADAIDLDHGLMSFNLEEVGVKQCMIGAAREVIVLADHTKFSKVAFVQIASLEIVDCIITGKELNEEIVKSLRSMGVEVIQV